MPGASVVRVLACAAGPACSHTTRGVSERGAWVHGSSPPARRDGESRRLVCALHAGVVIQGTAPHNRLAESMRWMGNGAGRGGPGGHPTLIHFLLEQTERVR